ncbi:hypothetical protein [Desulfolucanica intricata]|uniref:hypothetical protein n=1 Tax=Desulfolucanica intricata TaxID=1285191 RepID=UPI000831D87C|nr:hypothetical protein [Desulfolucanica intricata]
MKCKLCDSTDKVDFSISYGNYLCKVCDTMWKQAVNKVFMPDNSLFISNDKPKIISAKNKLKKLAFKHQRVC